MRSASAFLGLCFLAGAGLACSAKADPGTDVSDLPDSHVASDAGDVGSADGGDASTEGGFVVPDAAGLETDVTVPTGCRIGTLGSPASRSAGDIFAKWLDKAGTKVVGALGDKVLTASLLSPFKMLVVQDVSTGHAYSAAEAAALKKWVEDGGGLMTLAGFLGSPDEMLNVNRLLAPYAMSYGTDLILFASPSGATLPITNWVKHPVTKGITKIGFDVGNEPLGAGTAIANEGGHQVLRVKDVGSGHVLMWGDEWITFNDQWTSRPEYQTQMFWQNIVDWFDPGAECKVPDPVK